MNQGAHTRVMRVFAWLDRIGMRWRMSVNKAQLDRQAAWPSGEPGILFLHNGQLGIYNQ